MKSSNTYLIFEGTCRPAMEFYQRCLGGGLHFSTYADMPGGSKDLPAKYRDWIIHARLVNKYMTLMASDTQPEVAVVQGNNFFISLQCDDIEEMDKIFAALGEDGRIDMPLQETFWAIRYGMLTDQFGIKWMFNLEKKPA